MLKVLCPVCVAMYVVNIVLALILMRALGVSLRNLPSFILESLQGKTGSKPIFKWIPLYLIFAAAIFIGSVFVADLGGRELFQITADGCRAGN